MPEREKATSSLSSQGGVGALDRPSETVGEVSRRKSVLRESRQDARSRTRETELRGTTVRWFEWTEPAQVGEDWRAGEVVARQLWGEAADESRSSLGPGGVVPRERPKGESPKVVGVREQHSRGNRNDVPHKGTGGENGPTGVQRPTQASPAWARISQSGPSMALASGGFVVVGPVGPVPHQAAVEKAADVPSAPVAPTFCVADAIEGDGQ